MVTCSWKNDAEIVQVIFLNDEDDLLDPGAQSLLDQQQNNRLGDAVAVDDGKQLLLGCLGGREQARAESGGRDHGLAHFLPRLQCQRQTGHFQIPLDDFDQGLLIRRAARDELRGAVSLRTDSFAAPDVRFDGFVIQDAVQQRRGQFFRAGGNRVAVEPFLRFDHELAHAARVRRLPALLRPGARCAC